MSQAPIKDERSIEDILAAIRRQVADEQRAVAAADATGGGAWVEEPADLRAWAPWPEPLAPPSGPANDDAARLPSGDAMTDAAGADPAAAAWRPGTGSTVGRDPRPGRYDPQPGRSPGGALRPANDRAVAVVSLPLLPIGQASSASAVCASALALVRTARPTDDVRRARGDRQAGAMPPVPLRAPAPPPPADLGSISAAEFLDLSHAGSDHMRTLLKIWLEKNMPRLLAEALGHDREDGRRTGLGHGWPGH